MKKLTYFKTLLSLKGLKLTESQNIEKLSYNSLIELGDGIVNGEIGCETHIEQGKMIYVVEVYKTKNNVEVNVLTRKEYKQAYGYDYDNK